MIAIRLVPYGQTFQLSRKYITTNLVGSLLADALEQDPDATIIDIPNRVVTPASLQTLMGLAAGVEPAVAKSELEGAANYLNLPWLRYYALGAFDDLKDTVNLNDPENRPAIVDFIDEDSKSGAIFNYLLAKGYQPVHEDLLLATEKEAKPILEILKAFPFPPQPKRADLMKPLLSRIREESDGLEEYLDDGTFTTNATDAENLEDLVHVNTLISKGEFKNAWDYLYARGPNVPRIIWDVLTYMFARPGDPDERIRLEQEVRKIEWIPPLPT